MANASRPAVILALISALTGCGGGSSGPDETTRLEPPPPANNAPAIGGSPATMITRDQSYSFTPAGSDPDGDPLIFSISNQPTWATFDELTGSLTGTPTVADIGMTAGITISVSDGELSASLAPFDLEVVEVRLGSATVFWQIPETNADDSPLIDLAGFEVHYGADSRTYTEIVPIPSPTTESVLIDDLMPGTYYFAVLAVDTSGNKSEFSSEVSKEVLP